MSQTVLAIESSSERASVALLCAGQIRSELFSMEANRHAENLLPLITQLLLQHGIGRDKLDVLAVGTGPGSFTGLRAGVALSVGLSVGLSAPVFGVSSLAALAHSLTACLPDPAQSDDCPELLGALLDARRGEYFFAAYNRALELVIEPLILPQDSLCAAIDTVIQGRKIWVAGVAAVEQLQPVFLAPKVHYSDQGRLYPSAKAVAALVGTPHATTDPLPQYLREPDIKVPQLPPNPLVGVD